MYSKYSRLLFFALSLLFFPRPAPSLPLEIIARDRSSGQFLDGAHVAVLDTTLKAVTDENGRAVFDLPPGAFEIVCSHVGYREKKRRVVLKGEGVRLDLALARQVLELDETVRQEEREREDAGETHIAIGEASRLPSPTGDPLRYLKVLPGVSSGNDFSSAYQVLGGNRAENLVYINGIEIEMPMQIRRGLAETLSPVNPHMVGRMDFYAGVFPAQYGDKLSSLLDVRYREPEKAFVGRTSAAPLQQSATVEGRSGALHYIGGVRRADLGRLARGLQEEGAFEPHFRDAQAQVNWQLRSGRQVALYALALDSDFSMEPEGLRLRHNCSHRGCDQYSGAGAGAERFTYHLRALGASWQQARQNREIAVLFNGLEQGEDEDTDLQYRMVWRPLHGGSRGEEILLSERFASHVCLRRLSARGYARWQAGSRQWEWGGGGQWTHIRGAESGRERVEDGTRLYLDEVLEQGREQRAADWHIYGQHIWEGRGWHLRSGARLTHMGFSDETLLLPRLEVTRQMTARLEWLLATGRYAQAPLYRELVSADSGARLKAQRTAQASTALRYRLSQTALWEVETFYRRLERLITYDVDDLRLVYAGRNNARGFACGVYSSVRGQADKFIGILSYTFLVAREDVEGDGRGYLPRPADQRHAVSIYAEDRMAMDRFALLRASRFHLRLLYGTGFPHTPRVRDPRAENPYLLVEGARNSRRDRGYLRFDIGMTQAVEWRGWKVEMREEVLNLFDQYNVLGHAYLPLPSGAPLELRRALGRRLYNIALSVEWGRDS